MTLTGVQTGVQNRDPVVGKSPGESCAGLGGERDFRDQHERGLAGGQHLLDELQVHLGFARASHAVQHVHRSTTRKGFADRLNHPLLFTGETIGTSGVKPAGDVGSSYGFHQSDLQKPGSFQSLQGATGFDPGRFEQCRFGEGVWPRVFVEHFQNSALRGWQTIGLGGGGPGPMAVERSAGPTFHGGGDHRGQRHAHRALVVVTHPPRDLDQRLGKRGDPIINVNHALDAFWGQLGGRPLGHHPPSRRGRAAPQRHSDTGAQGDGVQFAGDGIS